MNKAEEICINNGSLLEDTPILSRYAGLNVLDFLDFVSSVINQIACFFVFCHVNGADRIRGLLKDPSYVLVLVTAISKQGGGSHGLDTY